VSRKRNERGQTVVLFALGATLLFGFAAIGFDLGLTMMDRRKLQAHADNAAIAGAFAYGSGPSVSTDTAHWIALNYLQRPLNFSLPNGSCTSSIACPAGTYTIGTYSVTIADPSSNRLDLSISHQEPAIFASVIGAGFVTTGSSARATQPYVAPCGMCVLASGPVPNAFDVQGNGTVTISGAGFQSNSTDPTTSAHLEANGGLSVAAPYSIGIAPGGGSTKGGTGSFSPAPVAHAPIPDSLANVPLPTTPTSCVAGPTSGTANPGCYTTLGGGGALLTLNPGTYIITQQLLLGNFGVTGNGVTLYFACSSWPTPCAGGGAAGGATVLGGSNGELNITAPAANSGEPYPGMAIFYDRNNTSALTLSGDGSATITGTVYAPSAQLRTSGNGGYTINGTVIVKTALLQANGGLTLTYDPNQNYTPPGGSGLIR
jgi:hypothetical protein